MRSLVSKWPDKPAPGDHLEGELVHPGNAEIVRCRDLVEPFAEQGDIVLGERTISQVARE